jgi:hypothetical protein
MLHFSDSERRELCGIAAFDQLEAHLKEMLDQHAETVDSAMNAILDAKRRGMLIDLSIDLEALVLNFSLYGIAALSKWPVFKKKRSVVERKSCVEILASMQVHNVSLKGASLCKQ